MAHFFISIVYLLLLLLLLLFIIIINPVPSKTKHSLFEKMQEEREREITIAGAAQLKSFRIVLIAFIYSVERVQLQRKKYK